MNSNSKKLINQFKTLEKVQKEQVTMLDEIMVDAPDDKAFRKFNSQLKRAAVKEDPNMVMNVINQMTTFVKKNKPKES